MSPLHVRHTLFIFHVVMIFTILFMFSMFLKLSTLVFLEISMLILNANIIMFKVKSGLILADNIPNNYVIN